MKKLIFFLSFFFVFIAYGNSEINQIDEILLKELYLIDTNKNVEKFIEYYKEKKRKKML